MIRALIQLEWRQSWNTIKTGGVKNYFVLIITFLITVGFLSLLSSGAFHLGRSMGTKMDILLPLSLIFLVAFIFILLFGIPKAFNQLFASSDLQALFTLPIPTKQLFLIKYIRTFIGIPGAIWLIMIVPLVSYGIGIRSTWVYYVALFFMTLSVALIAHSIIYLFNLGLIQILPASRAKELMTVMSAMAGVLIYLLFQLPNFLSHSHVNVQSLSTFKGMPAFLPTTIAAKTIVLILRKDIHGLIAFLLVLCITALLLFLSTMLVEKGFRRGWIRLSETRRRRVKDNRRTAKRIRQPVIMVGIKEWHTFRRDLREWMMFLPSLIFMFIPLLNLFSGSHFALHQHSLTAWLSIQAFFLFFFGLISGQLALVSVGREGRAAWILRVLPIKGWQIALGKYWISWIVPFVSLCIIEVMMCLFFSWPGTWVLAGIGIFALLSLGMTGISLWIGTLAPRYNPNNSQDRVQPGSRYLLMIINLVYMLIAAIFGFLILFPTQYQPELAHFVNTTSGFWYGVAVSSVWLLKMKAMHSTAIVSIGLSGLFLFSIGTMGITLYYSAKRFDSGIQIQMVQSTGERGGRMLRWK